MSKCVDERIGNNPGKPSFKIPLSSIKSIITMLKCLFDMTDSPLPFISAQEISIGHGNKTGMNKAKIFAKTISDMKAAGLNTGPNRDGSENLNLIATRAIIYNTIDNIKFDGRMDGSLPEGTLVGNGYAGTPIIVQKALSVKGILR